MLRAPQTWPTALVAVISMLLLAGLDLAGALAAKEAVERRSAALAVAGGALFLVLFWVFTSSLQYADLAPVTFGWIVVLQVGVVLIDRYRYHVSLPTGKWVAIVVILAAQTYLLLGPCGERPPTRQPAGVATSGDVNPR